jgi:hypothetical protein
MWQPFMTRLLRDTDVSERYTEHDLRGKVGSDEAGVERATDCSVTRARRYSPFRGCFAPQKREKEQLLLIGWGEFQSLGEAFALLGGDIKTLVIFSKLVGRVGIEPTTN